ncbi:hypothetical protein EDC04DRAFT_2600611 [Pisolithus marmoratus]|nr:hypothetical protein EDC04DRAFT_2600611 [Pisolithus marmoratus]
MRRGHVKRQLLARSVPPHSTKHQTSLKKEWSMTTIAWYRPLVTWMMKFVNHNMFMHFRGGGVGHMASHHWDGFLQSDCPKFKARKDETFDTEYSGDMGGDASIADSDADEGDGPIGSDMDSDSDSDGQENDEVVEDIVASNGEELDDAIYIEEGYGAP